jgi:threonylcarbamoyladenosine tRNA methylthiotransferase MtaB
MPNALARRPRVSLITLGCKLNQADSEAVARELLQHGIDVVDRPAPADAFVVNTCSVTHVADRKARHMVRLARRLAPNAPVALTGCYVETDPAAARATGADLVLGNAAKREIAAHIVAALAAVAGQRHPPPSRRGLRTRAFVKVQAGCNDVCAFCIVPKTRGREVSESVADVVREVLAREAEGVQEVVLTGTQLGAYGRDAGALQPADVIRAVLAETAVPRIRFSSLQPQDITPELLALWEDPRLCRHFHLALQSGCDRTLAAMRRRYTTTDFRRAVTQIRAFVGDDTAITTDVIAGFPGESDADFAESLAFVEEMRFAGVHVFPYSRRSGTTADKLPGHLPYPVKHARTQRLLAAATASQRAFAERFLGRTMAVLWERASNAAAPACWDGLTDNYLRVVANSARDLRNTITPARLRDVRDDGVIVGEAI